MAGEAAIAPRVRALLAADAASPVADGDLLVARAPDGGVIAVLAGNFAIRTLLEHDLRAAAAALATAAPAAPGA
jgi:hypothetical protein